VHILCAQPRTIINANLKKKRYWNLGLYLESKNDVVISDWVHPRLGSQKPNLARNDSKRKHHPSPVLILCDANLVPPTGVGATHEQHPHSSTIRLNKIHQVLNG